MAWLKKVGLILGKVTELVLGFGPIITALTPTKKDDELMAKLADPLSQVAGIVIQIEAMANVFETPLPGTDKLKMATPMVAQILLSSAIMADQEIANPTLFKQGCSSIASGVVDVLNSLKDNVKTINKA